MNQAIWTNAADIQMIQEVTIITQVNQEAIKL